MTTKTDIFNMILGVLDEAARIDVWNEATPTAQIINRQYDLARKELLQLHPWKHATRRVSINKYSTDPEFGWNYQYPLPDDYIQMHPIQKMGTFEGDMVAYDIEQLYINENERIRVIVTNATSPIKFCYTCDTEDPALFTPLYTRGLIYRTASYVAHAITRKDSYAKRMTEMFNQVLVAAKGADNMSATMPKPDDSAYVDLHEEYLGGIG